MISEKQLEANRINAQKSTGPKSPEGKAIARRNALKHGMAGEGVVMPIDEQIVVEQRMGELWSSLRPANAHEEDLLELYALESVRAERCRRLERERRQRLLDRALDEWDEDRTIEAARLGASLASNPDVVSKLLRKTLQGCDWLLERWRGLALALDRHGDWTADQRRLALDMLGTNAPELRDGITPLDTDDPSAARRTVVSGEIDRLTRRKDDVLEARDEADQRAAVEGAGAENDDELKRLRRYERSCQRRKEWALKQFRAKPRPRPGACDPDEPAIRHAQCVEGRCVHNLPVAQREAPTVPTPGPDGTTITGEHVTGSTIQYTVGRSAESTVPWRA